MSNDAGFATNLAGIFPPDAVFMGPAMPGTIPWLPAHEMMDVITGNVLPILGGMDAIVHRACLGPHSRRLLELAGVDFPKGTMPYDSTESLPGIARDLSRKGRRLALQHSTPVKIPGVAWLVPPGTLSQLNDKARLARYVPIDHLPHRIVLSPGEIDPCVEPPFRLPLVLKASSAYSSGAGYDVRICRSMDDWRGAIAFFRGKAGALNGLVVEHFLNFKATWCGNLAVTAEGCSWLGAAQQVTSDAGAYLGNWCGRGYEPPDAAQPLLLGIAERARQMGYVGIAGMDFGLTEDGRLLVFDLNFRINGCTPQLLLHASHPTFRHMAVSLFSKLTTNLAAKEIVRLAASLIEAGELLPLGLFDRGRHPAGSPFSVISFLLAGPSNEAVQSQFDIFAASLRSSGSLLDRHPLGGNCRESARPCGAPEPARPRSSPPRPNTPGKGADKKPRPDRV